MNAPTHPALVHAIPGTSPPTSLSLSSLSGSSTGSTCRPFSAVRDCECDRKPHSAKLVLRKQDTVLDLSTLRTLKFPKEFRTAPIVATVPAGTGAGQVTAAVPVSHLFSLLFEPFATTGYALVSITSHQPCADAHFPPFTVDVQVRTDQQICVEKRVVHQFCPESPAVVIDRLRSPVEMFEDFDAGRTVTIVVTLKRAHSGSTVRFGKVIKRVQDLRMNRELTDVVLRAKDGEAFPAHRVVLASRSEYFDSMFCGDLSESQLGVVDFPEESAETLAVVLDYIYTDRVPENLPSYSDIFVAADKYRLVELMQLVRDRLPVMPITALVGMVRLVYGGQVVAATGLPGDAEDLEQQVLAAVKDRLPTLKMSASIAELFLDPNCHRLIVDLL